MRGTCGRHCSPVRLVVCDSELDQERIDPIGADVAAKARELLDRIETPAVAGVSVGYANSGLP